MISEVTITIKPQDEKNQKLIQKAILAELTKKNVYVGNQNLSFVFVKKSIDARHGQVKYHLRYKVFIGEKSTDIKTSELSEWKNATGNISVAVSPSTGSNFAKRKVINPTSCNKASEQFY